MSLTTAIGLTGSIGSGKSAAAEIFKALGAYIVDADDLARKAVLPGSGTLAEISSLFGAKVLTPEGDLNRGMLKEIVFNDPDKRKALEAIVHPAVRILFLSRLKEFREQNAGKHALLVYSVPLLFESGYHYNELDKIAVISAPKEVCLKRIVERDGCSLALAEKIYSAQLPISAKEARADYVIKNDKDFKYLKRQVKKLFDILVCTSHQR